MEYTLYTRWVNDNAYCLAMLCLCCVVLCCVVLCCVVLCCVVLCCVVLCCVVLSGQMGHLDEEQALTNP
jgi:uncharacterized membrane protein